MPSIRLRNGDSIAGESAGESAVFEHEINLVTRITQRHSKRGLGKKSLIDELDGFSPAMQEALLRSMMRSSPEERHVHAVGYTPALDRTDGADTVNVTEPPLLLAALRRHAISMHARNRIAEIIIEENWRPSPHIALSRQRGAASEYALHTLLNDFIAQYQLNGELDIVREIEQLEMPAGYTLEKGTVDNYILTRRNQVVSEFDAVLCGGVKGEKLYCIDVTTRQSKELAKRHKAFSKFRSRTRGETNGDISPERIDILLDTNFGPTEECKPGIWRCRFGIRNAIDALSPRIASA